MVCLVPDAFGITIFIALAVALSTLAVPKFFFGFFPLVMVLGDSYLFAGNLVVQPSDAILLASAGSLWWRNASIDALPNRSFTAFEWILTFGFIGCLFAFITGYWALPAADWGDQVSVYFSRWNAVRIGRGFAWGAMFFLISKYCNANGASIVTAFSNGMQATLLAVGVIVAVERGLFEGLWDFSDEFRATGPFSSMHIGGQHLDAFLTLSIPFAFFRFGERSRSGKCLTLLLVLLATYVALSTMSRATLAVVLAMIVFLSISHFGWLKTELEDRRRLHGALYAIISLFVVGLAILAAWKADAIRYRFSFLRADWQTRVSHWSTSIHESQRSWDKLLFGYGMGTFPTIQARSQNHSIPPLEWRAANSGTVRISPNWPIYLQQWVRFSKSPSGICLVKARAIGGEASIGVAVCKQALLKSYLCREDHGVLEESSGETWQELSLRLPSASRTESSVDDAEHDYRPTVFSLYHAGGPGIIEIAGVSFSDENSSRPLLLNGEFRNGTGRWFFSSDDHLAWHSKNIFVHLLVEHGIIGLLVFLTFLATWLVSACRSFRMQRDTFASMLAASIVGTLSVAMFDSLLDTPTLIALFFAVAFAQPRAGNVCDGFTSFREDEPGREGSSLMLPARAFIENRKSATSKRND
jgi:hypothetical protein